MGTVIFEVHLAVLILQYFFKGGLLFINGSICSVLPGYSYKK